MTDAIAASDCADDLTKAGFDYDQARALVNFIVRSQENLATKEGLRELGRKIDHLTAKISGPEGKIDSLALDMKAEFKALGDRLARKLFLFWLGITGAMFVIMVLYLALYVHLQGSG